MRAFAELEINLQRRDQQTCTISLRFLPLNDDATWLDDAIGTFSKPKLRPGEADIDPARYGQNLSEALFFAKDAAGDLVRTVVAEKFAEYRRQATGGLCVRLVVPPDLQPLRWETMRDPDPLRKEMPLFADGSVFLSRYLNTKTEKAAARSRPRSRLSALIVVANVATSARPFHVTEDREDDEDGDHEARELAPVDVEGELGRALEALASVGNKLTLVSNPASSVPVACVSNILAKLRTGVDVLYLVCHGALVAGEPRLYLESENKNGPYKPVAAKELIQAIHDLPQVPRLIVLASCQSAGSSQDSGILSALGPRLLAEAGVGAVVAMQGNITMETVKVFMPEFFKSMLDQHLGDGQIDRAMTMARGVAKRKGRDDYWMPALFMRLTDGRLWSGDAAAEAGRVCNVPALPSGFIPRPTLADAIVTALTCGSDDGGPANTVVNGAGGFGKTTLAIDACLRAEVVAAFPDGVLWTSLGEKPDLVPLLSDLYAVATGARPTVAGLDPVAQALAAALKERSCLVAVDDVWRAEDLKPFLQLSGVRLLVTTRKKTLLHEAALDADEWQEVQVEEMEPGEASALLCRGLGLEGRPPDAYGQLAEQLGGWPLLLDLVNARLREEKKSGRGIEFVSRLFEKKGVIGFDRRDSNSRTSAVAASVEVGLEQVEKMFPGLDRKATEISIFPGNIDIPVQMLQHLWELDEFDLEEEVLRPLDDLSLLSWDREAGDIKLQQMIDRALEERLKKDGGPAVVHRRLIDAWGDPLHLPHDYAWRWFGWHCVQANDVPRLQALLVDVNWLRAKLDATDISALLSEFDHVGGDPEVELVRDVLRLSAHVLAKDKSQLESQLLGRIPHQQVEIRRRILESARGVRDAWLRPLRASLAPPGGPLLFTLAGHEKTVTAVALTPDGARAISGSKDHTLKVWDLTSGQALHTLKGHSGPVTAVALAADGTRAVSAGDDTLKISVAADGTRSVSIDYGLRVWDLASGEVLRTLEGLRGAAYAVALTADGTRVVSASRDDLLRVWDLATGDVLDVLMERGWGVALAADGARALSASASGTLSVWDLASGEVLRTLEGHTQDVCAVALTADGTRAASVSWDGTLRVWNLASGEALAFDYEGRGDCPVALTAGGVLVASSEDNALTMWDLARGGAPQVLGSHTGRVTAVTLTADGTRAVSASRDRTLMVWDLARGQASCPIERHSGPVTAVALAANGIHAVSASEDGTLVIWDLTSGEAVARIESNDSAARTVAFTADGARLVSASGDHTLTVWDLTGDEAPRTLEGHTQDVYAVALTADGTRAVSASGDHTLTVWDLASGEALRTLEGHTRDVYAVALTADGTRAVSASWDQTLRVWDLARGEVLHTLEGHTQRIWAVALTDDGTRAVSASDDHTLRVWDLATGEALHTLAGHTLEVFAVALTADGARAVSASEDHTLKIWDLASGEVLHTLEGHTGGVTEVTVTADGTRTVSVSRDRAVVSWDLETGTRVAAFTGDAPMTAVVLAADGRTMVAGDNQGRVHFLHIDQAP